MNLASQLRSQAVALAGAALLACGAAAEEKAVNAGPYVPSPTSVVSSMLREAGVGPNDFVIDLGSGDGRIVRTAATVFGARGFGVDIDEKLVRESNEAAQKEGIAERVKFYRQDLFKTDISQATVLTMYLLPTTVNLLHEKLLRELKPGTRIVSHDYPLTGWRPQRTLEFDLEEKVNISGVTTTIVWLYVVPARVQGSWHATVPASVSKTPLRLDVQQKYTNVSGSTRLNGRAQPLEDFRIQGDTIRFTLSGPGTKLASFAGQVRGDAIAGTVSVGGTKSPWSATLAK